LKIPTSGYSQNTEGRAFWNFLDSMQH
jgi:hypothetical protein